MSSHPLTITITAPPAGSAEENYWIRLVQTNADGDFATVADAAQVIDAVFEINPCEDAGTGGEAAELNPDGTYATAVAEADFANVVKGVIDFDACLAAGRYDWTATLAIIRSHNAIPYNLVIEGGQLVQTVVVTGQIAANLVFSGETSLDLEFPVVAGFSAAWSGRVVTESGNPPQVTLLGSTINLTEAATGNLSLRYLTEYDRATITIPGNGETSLQSAEVLAFWHYLVEPFTLSPPEIDATSAGDRLLCSQQVDIDIPEETLCWETVSQYTLCSCGDGEYDRVDVEQSVSCPEGASPGDHFMGTRSVLAGYADCGKPAFDDISTPEFYEQKCCVPPPFPLPRCITQRSVMGGGVGIVNGPQYYLDTYGPGTRIVGVSPRDGICGTIEWQQRIAAENCCEDAVPLVAHPDNPSTIAPGGSVEMRVTGGDPDTDFLWTASGGLMFINGTNTIFTGHNAQVFAPEQVCPNNVVRVDDGCSAINMPLHGPDDPLSISVPPGEYTFRGVFVEVTGGVPPLILTTSGNHTHFSNGLREIAIGSGGLVQIFVDPPQVCDGDFTVAVSDRCAAVESATVPIAITPAGIACVRYVSDFASLNDWTDGPMLGGEGFPAWISYSGLAETDNYWTPALYIPEGDYIVAFGSLTDSASFVHVSRCVVDNVLRTCISTAQMTDIVVIPQYCDECIA